MTGVNRLIIRNATPADAGEILNIYRPYVTDSRVSFETEAPTKDEFTARIENIIKDYPYLVCETNDMLAGYAYASKFRERAAYKYSAEVSVYVAREYHRQGVGTALYARLFDMMKARGIYTAFAGITLPNDSSVGLHKSFGFGEVGVYRNVGYKFGMWLDVMWMEKALREYDRPDKG